MVPAGEVVGHPVVVSVDAATLGRLGDLGAVFERAEHNIVIDHHVSNSGFGELNLIDPAADCTSILILAVLDELGAEIDADIATCVYAGLITDTGSFKWARPESLRVGARLLDTGVDGAAWSRVLLDSHPVSWLSLVSKVLGGARFDANACDGHGVIYAVVEHDMMGPVGWADVESIIDVLRVAEEAEVAAVFRRPHRRSGPCRCGPGQSRSRSAGRRARRRWPSAGGRLQRQRCGRRCGRPVPEVPLTTGPAPADGTDGRVPDTGVRRIAVLSVSALVVLVAPPFYLLLDLAVVGRLGGHELAALGVGTLVLATISTQLTFLSYGTTARSARLFGAGDRGGAVREGVQATWVALGVGVLLIVLAYPLAPVVMGALVGSGEDGSAQVAADATRWVRIAMFGVPLILASMAGNGWMRGVQDTRRPVLFVLCGLSIGAAGVIGLVHGVGWFPRLGLTGSAVANVVGQSITGRCS